ncbi:MAG: polyprenol monophosphomannose synthase [Acidimicrobiia bacterium]|jgi:dolichol-phosphate mannosyltransferase|nr:polyprenol monophosphomannose synthase [Acidimicrobiia bacterium]MBA3801830.1 polyprenol monophosphomannose synthase [Acidimicrobiia bacterium]
MRLVIVLPTYNEADNVAAILHGVREAVGDASILVVDDNSPDGTGRIADEIATELGNISVLHRQHKAGLGAAYRAGFAEVLDQEYDAVVSMDADFSHDPASLPALRKALDHGADIVVGSRYVTGGGVTDWPVRRQLLSKWGNRYTRAVLGVAPYDITSGFRAYRTDALRTIKPESTTAEGYAFLTELIRRGSAAGLRIEETPIVFRDRTRGKSKMSGRIMAESMWLVTRWGIADRFGRRR